MNQIIITLYSTVKYPLVRILIQNQFIDLINT